MKRQLWAIFLEVKCKALLVSEEIPKASRRNLSLQAKRYLWSTDAARHDSMEMLNDFKFRVGMKPFGQGRVGWGDKS